MLDLTPDQLDDWLDQDHTLFVITVSLGEVNVKVECSKVTDACRYWEDCAEADCMVDDDPADTRPHIRHAEPHRWDPRERMWTVPTDSCITRRLPMSEKTEHAILASRLVAGSMTSVTPKPFHESMFWKLDLTPDGGHW